MIRHLKFVFALALLAAAIYLLDRQTLVTSLARLTPNLILVLVCMNVMLFWVTALRWVVLTRLMTSAPIMEQLRIYFYANLLNSITPANLGGDAYRVIAIKSELGLTAATIAIIQERVLGLWGFLGIFLGSYILAQTQGYNSFIDGLLSYVAAASLAFVCGTILLAILSRALNQKLSKWASRHPRIGLALSATLQLKTTDYMLTLFLSLLSTFIWVSSYWLVSTTLGLDMSWAVLGMLSVLVEIVRLVPISIQGIGVRETTAAILASKMGMTYETGFLMATICYIINTVSMLLTGGFGALLTFAKKS